jgi:hypothetical protein
MKRLLRLRHVANVVAPVTLFLCLSIGLVESDNNVDVFNYDYPNEGVPGGGGTDYGQPSWGKVSCDDLEQCVSTMKLKVYAESILMELLLHRTF